MMFNLLQAYLLSTIPTFPSTFISTNFSTVSSTSLIASTDSSAAAAISALSVTDSFLFANRNLTNPFESILRQHILNTSDKLLSYPPPSAFSIMKAVEYEASSLLRESDLGSEPISLSLFLTEPI
ncbi:hypothetical protein HYC85_009890 [Camellia sinensis]|uniref:Uncharacterized protein n=1 Tax=Camellia sinensis TaxID=4442 RepID=A0A7J7HJ56_CAMSI|nr:hypothetical protein HYC85_009890 [Camellia sinensis]